MQKDKIRKKKSMKKVLKNKARAKTSVVVKTHEQNQMDMITQYKEKQKKKVQL